MSQTCTKLLKEKSAKFDFSWAFRFGRKLSVIRGIVEQEIQAMVSKRDNIATHHLYQAWDPVPSLSPATTGKSLFVGEKGRMNFFRI